MGSVTPLKTVPQKAYEPTEREASSLAAYSKRRARAKPLPRFKSEMDEGACQISVDHPDQDVAFKLLAEAFGVSDQNALTLLIHDLAGIAQGKGEIPAAKLNGTVALMHGIEPTNS